MCMTFLTILINNLKRRLVAQTICRTTNIIFYSFKSCLIIIVYFLFLIPRQQTNRIQVNTATHLDIRDRAMGMQHQDSPNIPIKNAQNDQ